MTVVIPTGARVIEIDLDTAETNIFKNVPYNTNEMFYSTDIGMAFLKFTGLTQDYTGCTARLTLINFNDGSKVQRTFEMNTTTTFVYPMLETELAHAGRWIGQLTVIKNGTTISDNPFRFKIDGTILTTALISFDNINTFTSQLTTIYDGLNTFLDVVILDESERSDAEGLRVVAEGLRVTSEELRVIADAARETKEGIRESTFVTNEGARQVTFEGSEGTRQSTFNANEITRTSIVNSLVTAETIAQLVAEKYQLIEATQASRLLSAEQQLAQAEADILLINRGLGATISSLALLLSTYPTGDTKDHIVAGNITEIDTLTVTAIPTVASNITITLNGVAKTVAVDPAIQTTTDLVATAIRGTAFTGWTTGGTGSVVTFVATTTGARTVPTFSGGTTGVTAAFAITIKGENANFHRYFWNGIAWADGGAYQAIELVDGIVTESKTSFFKTGKNLFDGLSYSGYINTSGVFGASGTYVYINRIKTKGLSAIIWSGLSGDGVTRTGRTARFVTAYDANNNVLTAYSMENVAQYTVPDPIVAYVILTFATSTFSASSFQVESGTTITNYEYYYNKIAPEYLLFSKTEFLKRMLQGKKVAIFGDSIMWGAGSSGVALGELLAQKYGMIVYKYAISGAVMGQFPTKSHIADQVSTAIATGIVFDFIFFNGGTNDMYETADVPNCPLGVITTDYVSVFDETAFSGGFEKVAKLLCDSFPYAVKAYVRPHNMASRPYDNQITYGENGLKICEKWGFGYVDMYKTMNTWLSYYQTKYLFDSTHPNLVGYTDKYLPETEKFIFNTLFI